MLETIFPACHFIFVKLYFMKSSAQSQFSIPTLRLSTHFIISHIVTLMSSLSHADIIIYQRTFTYFLWLLFNFEIHGLLEIYLGNRCENNSNNVLPQICTFVPSELSSLSMS
jgi:hypothetical protein